MKTSFSHQIQILTTLSGELEQFRNKLENLSDDFEKSLINLHDESGLMDEIYIALKKQSVDRIKNALYTLTAKIGTEDISFIEQEIDFMSVRLDTYNNYIANTNEFTQENLE